MTESIVRNMPGMVSVKDMPLLQDGCKPMDAEDCEVYTDVFFIKFAQVSDARCKPMDAEDCEDYTDVFFIKFAHVSDAR
ncbi:hypothetical protein ZWY2020_059756 [Hordeum vulgare]|nr:hypothetical protein ZWY2020_059756 [Hordeum vulgare]